MITAEENTETSDYSSQKNTQVSNYFSRKLLSRLLPKVKNPRVSDYCRQKAHKWAITITVLPQVRDCQHRFRQHAINVITNFNVICRKALVLVSLLYILCIFKLHPAYLFNAFCAMFIRNIYDFYKYFELFFYWNQQKIEKSDGNKYIFALFTN